MPLLKKSKIKKEKKPLVKKTDKKKAKEKKDASEKKINTEREKEENKKIMDSFFTSQDSNNPDTGWESQDYEDGELSIDVYADNANNIVIKSTIAGVKPEDIDISVNNDILTIRGKRGYEETREERNYFFKECYWGSFSRSLILPCEIQSDNITASLKSGILTITLPKAKHTKKSPIKIISED